MDYFVLDYPERTGMFEKTSVYKDIIQYEPRKELGLKLDLIILLGQVKEEYRVSYAKFNEQNKPIDRINRMFQAEEEAREYLFSVFEEIEEQYRIKLMFKTEGSEGD